VLPIRRPPFAGGAKKLKSALAEAHNPE